MKRRVVITGLGAVTPTGLNVKQFWNSCREGKIGIADITYFDTTDYKAKLAAELKGFDAKDFMDAKAAKRMEAFSQYAVAASAEALNDSGINLEKEDSYRVGVSIGSGIGSLQAMEREHIRLLDKGPGRVSPLLVPMMISNMAAGNVGIVFGLKGKNINIVTACATGTHCIGEAFRSIAYGEAEVMLAGGSEASISPIGVSGFSALTALNTTHDANRASIPFDKERAGFVMGEGAGVLVLEELNHAIARGARIYAEMAGYGATCDAYHITSPVEDGSGAAMAMKYALDDAGFKPEDIDYVNAHGTSTPYNDLFETKALKLAFGAHAYKMKINSTKSMIGHLLGAAGGVEGLVCVKSIEESFVHQTAGLMISDEECDLDYCKGSGADMTVNTAMSNSLGFGGHNASIIFKKYKD